MTGLILGIYNSDGLIVARYVYDAFGNHKVYDGYYNANTNDSFIGNINPFRYKSYYYDKESNLYYLNSRYYSPIYYRFISIDDIDYLKSESINGINLYAYCGNDPINYTDPSGHMAGWLGWVLGGLVVVGLFAATIIFAGGFFAGCVAIYSAMCGFAFGTAATTISSFAFVGAATTYIGLLAYNSLNIATAGIRGSTYEKAFNDFMEMGDDAFISTLSSGIVGVIGGYISYDDQLRGLDHSWATERKKFFENNPQLDKSMVLHHPYGRHGANIRFYYPVTVEEHKRIHHELGYGRGQGGFYQYREWINWWKELISHF